MQLTAHYWEILNVLAGVGYQPTKIPDGNLVVRPCLEDWLEEGDDP